jgi:hypothetical protein
MLFVQAGSNLHQKNWTHIKKGISNHTCIVACTITRRRSINMTSEEKTETKEKKQIRRDNKGNIIEEKYETETKTESK